jgi:hypothetical protein
MDEFKGMTAAEIRAALDEYTRSTRPAPAPAPLPPGCADLSPKSQETASQLYGEAILRKSPATWTQAERDFIRGSVGAALREMGR